MFLTKNIQEVITGKHPATYAWLNVYLWYCSQVFRKVAAKTDSFKLFFIFFQKFYYRTFRKNAALAEI